MPCPEPKRRERHARAGREDELSGFVGFRHAQHRHAHGGGHGQQRKDRDLGPHTKTSLL